MNKSGLIGLVLMVLIGVYYLGMQNKVTTELTASVGSMMAIQETAENWGEEPAEEVAVGTAPEDVRPALPASDFKIVDGEGRNVSRSAAAALLRPYDLTRGRTAELLSFVDPQSLLREGEVLPDVELRGLMVEARSAALADKACATLKQSVAAECGVTKYQTGYIGELKCERCSAADRLRRKPFVGKYQITTKMAYTPKTPVGVFPDSSRVLLNNKTFELKEMALRGPDGDAVATRFAFMVEAAERACAEIRALHGNCVVSNIKLSKNVYVNRGNFSEIPGSFRVSYFSALDG